MQTIKPQQYREWSRDVAQEAIQAFVDQPGALISALHRIQEIFGYVDDEAIIMLASTFNLTRAEVHGVASFYHDFRRSKPGKFTVRICQAEACQAMGSDALSEAAKESLGADFHETSTDGNFSLEPVYCLGNCACSPNIMVDSQVYARMNPEKFSRLMQSLAKEAN